MVSLTRDEIRSKQNSYQFFNQYLIISDCVQCPVEPSPEMPLRAQLRLPLPVVLLYALLGVTSRQHKYQLGQITFCLERQTSYWQSYS